jgi:hypothetical protein
MSTNRFLYTAWFRNTAVGLDDQDCEWPACFIIEATSADMALSWGDRLAKSFSEKRTTELYLRSNVQDECFANGDTSTLPVVQFGCDASDVEIGW